MNMYVFNSSSVRIVKSYRSGMGKSLFVSRLAERLQDHLGVSDVHVTIPLHGPIVTLDSVLELFKDHSMDPKCCIYHLDIAPNVRNIWQWLQQLQIASHQIRL